ncbi:MAG: Response regulator PleD [Phycisphaerae bacterium]|nr:Response regulator PleD [Phycisphaerae bacterium]
MQSMNEERWSARVLIVDDNEQNVELLQAYLEELPGVETLTAANGVEALDLANQQLPDMILLDIMMPRMSGYEVCKHLKNESRTREIPVIMITALNESSDYERAMECGADDFLTRPLNRAEFLARLRSMLRIRQLRNSGG